MNRHARRHGGIVAQPLPNNVTVETQYGHDGQDILLINSIPVVQLRLTIEQAEKMILGITQAIAGLREHKANLTQAGQNVG